MRQPASLSNALPRHDHQEYGPRDIGVQHPDHVDPARREQVGEPLPFGGRNPDFFTLPFQFLMSFSVCAMFQSPHTTASRSGQRRHPRATSGRP